MALTFAKLFQPQQLPNAVAPIYTMPSGPNTIVLKNGRVRLVNTTAGAVSATLYAVPSGGSPVASNECLPAVSIAANSYLDVDVPDLAVGDSLQGFASAATSITIHEMGGVLYS